VLGKGEACSRGIAHRTLSKQSLLGQVSAKLTSEICINKASSNSRLTAAGRQATATDTTHRTVSRLFFFSLPTFDEKKTELHLHAEKLAEMVLHLNLGQFVGFFSCFVQFCSILCYPFDETTTEQYLRHHLQDCRLRDEQQND
jgi:hypothetical protein